MALVLEPIQFYTALDPYYYVVDNRPLEDIETNLNNIITEFNNQSGEAKRAGLGATASAYTTIGYYPTEQPNYVGSFRFNTLDILMNFGSAITFDNINNRPVLSVHNGQTRLTADVGGSPTTARKNVVFATPREPSQGDGDFGANVSDILVVDLTIIASGNYVYDATSPYTGAPTVPTPAGSFPIFDVVVPGGTTNLNNLSRDHWRYLQMKSVDQVANPLDNAILTYVEEQAFANVGDATIQITDPVIDYVGNPEAIELFIQGLNQFDFILNPVTGLITLPSPIPGTPGDTAEYRIRQLKISLG